MKRVLMIALLTIVAAASALAQSAQPMNHPKMSDDTKSAGSMPSIDQIIEKHVQASGGKAAIEKLSSRVEKGSFEVPAMGAGGSFEGYTKAPNKSVVIINVPGFGVVSEGYNGAVGWSQNPVNGLREKSGVELASTKLDSEFYKNIKLKQLYPQMTLKGKEKIGEREAYIIEAVPATGVPEKMYFDTQTGLLLRHDIERETPHGKVAIEIYFEDYKEVDGVKEPFTLRQVTPALSFIIKIEEIKHNVEIDEAKFAKPAGQ